MLLLVEAARFINRADRNYLFANAKPGVGKASQVS